MIPVSGRLFTAISITKSKVSMSTHYPLLRRAGAPILALCFLGLTPASRCSTPGDAPQKAETATLLRRDRLPRKILVGTEISGYDLIEKFTLEQRLQRMDQYVDAMELQASFKYPGKRLDLVLFGEYFMARGREALAENAIRLDEVVPRIAACAQRHGCYLVVPLVLREDGPVERYSNAALLMGRDGRVVGIYRKVHPTTDLKYVVLEGGVTPGSNFPVFDCDFGRVGIQICMDISYPDGWEALAKQGAEIVLLPSETPQTIRPIDVRAAASLLHCERLSQESFRRLQPDRHDRGRGHAGRCPGAPDRPLLRHRRLGPRLG
jgi:hypothetical protein